MQKFTLVASIILGTTLAHSLPPASAASAASKTYIVVFKRNLVPANQVPQMTRQMAQVNRGRVRHIYQNIIQGSALELSEAAVQALRQNPLVETIEVDQTIQLIAPLSTTITTTTTSTQEIPWGITRVGSFGNGTGKTAWVLDTGIDLTHPDLRVDQQRCFSVFTSGTEAALGCNDGNGHGTHVAGTIAALNNTIGVVGVAAGATVVPVKVLDSTGAGTVAGAIAGIDYLVKSAKVGDVANMSLASGISSTFDNAVRNAASKGIKFVLAAGNSAQNANNFSPARANGTNIFTISAFAQGNVFASFSNFGNPPIDYAAPGVNIKSTWKNGGYAILNGTSMAAPHAAGVLLLGAPKQSGTVTGDRDTTPDRIISR